MDSKGVLVCGSVDVRLIWGILVRSIFGETLNYMNILVVDDTPDNLRLLSNILVEEGFQVHPVSNGEKAISAAQARPPDLILLDIMMPDMDGYTVCKHLKADELTREVPVILMSTQGEVFDKVKGFTLGAVDYITKPFEAEEVLSRVRTHGRLRLMQRQLHDQNLQLQQEITERKRAEEALQKVNATKNTFFSILAHDLRSPFSSLLGSAELALEYFDQSSLDEIRQHLVRIKKSADTFYALLENVLAWARLQRGRVEYSPENIPVHELVRHLAELFVELAEQKQIAINNDVPQDLSVYADINMLNVILRNLLSNALKFTPPQGTITLTARQCEQKIEISIADTGIGIAEADIPNLLRLDNRTTTLGTAGEQGTGLGLPLCNELIEKNKGTLQITSILDQGITVLLTLPASAPTAGASSQILLDNVDKEHILQALRTLPKETIADLSDAVEAFNLTQTKTLLEIIRTHNQPLAEILIDYANHFQFEELQTLCHEALFPS